MYSYMYPAFISTIHFNLTLQFNSTVQLNSKSLLQDFALQTRAAAAKWSRTAALVMPTMVKIQVAEAVSPLARSSRMAGNTMNVLVPSIPAAKPASRDAAVSRCAVDLARRSGNKLLTLCRGPVMQRPIVSPPFESTARGAAGTGRRAT